ncbi:Crp/Fnr family transcriptional regulator [Polynucleobacter sp. 71A-WALBACH]|nr:Crp/Fnr family transcriptional regulator [Polynucleobacter sp. 71A-WALBACH]
MQLENLTGQYVKKIKIKSGDPIFHNGDPIHALYNVRVGFLKVEYSLPNGHHQVNHFATQGTLVGTDGIADGKHRLDAIAITDGELCSIDFVRIQSLMKAEAALQEAIGHSMSKEINRTQEHLFSLGSHSTEQKIAHFLIDLHDKLGETYSRLDSLRLPMKREDLKSYLGMTSESLSRGLTSLEKNHYFQIRNREISAIDYGKLQQLLESPN